MKSKKKLIVKKYARHKQHAKTYSKTKKGGVLITNPETDLVNMHICNSKNYLDKDTPGLELLMSISKPFPLNNATLGYLQQMYKSEDDKWFKFTIFNNNHTYFIYIIDGAKINKHSICMLQGLLEVTKNDGEYDDLRKAVNELQYFKNIYGSNMESMQDETKNKCFELINRINELIERDIKCMPIISAGSGSINADNSVCLNNKSGHYKPTSQSMLKAKEIFEQIIGGKTNVHIKDKEDKNILKEKYGENASNYSGICLP